LSAATVGEKNPRYFLENLRNSTTWRYGLEQDVTMKNGKKKSLVGASIM